MSPLLIYRFNDFRSLDKDLSFNRNVNLLEIKKKKFIFRKILI